jgi:predicted PhzF superfamily epimerase YddE/YHI9
MSRVQVKFPSQYESNRLKLCNYQAGDGAWYYAMSIRNRAHLQRYEPDNPTMQLANEQAAEVLVRGLAEAGENSAYFFIRAFDRYSGEFVA